MEPGDGAQLGMGPVDGTARRLRMGPAADGRLQRPRGMQPPKLIPSVIRSCGPPRVAFDSSSHTTAASLVALLNNHARGLHAVPSHHCALCTLGAGRGVAEGTGMTCHTCDMGCLFDGT